MILAKSGRTRTQIINFKEGRCGKREIAEQIMILKPGRKKMGYENNEGYSDPTAGKAIRAANRMPTHIYNAYCVINNVDGLLGLEITGLRDKKSGKEWKR